MKKSGYGKFYPPILAWYRQNMRSLPWRQTQDPYKVWLSEIILQQTRVTQGMPYYNRFIKKYNTVFELANAPEDDVLRLWQGLGYYSRARNLHKCARLIANDYKGEFPNSMKDLLLLPGIGRYTAAAIASICFNEPVPVIDGNVYRVLARYFADDFDISASRASDHFYQLSASLIDRDNPGEYNQGMMELGATICSPKQANCEECPIQEGCQSFALGQVYDFPVKSKKIKSRSRYFYYLVFRTKNQLLLRQRIGKDIWQGLYEFVLVESRHALMLDQIDHPALVPIHRHEFIIAADEKKHRHVLSHQILNVKFAIIELGSDTSLLAQLVADGYAWYDLAAVEDLPKPILLANYLDSYLNSIDLQ